MASRGRPSRRVLERVHGIISLHPLWMTGCGPVGFHRAPWSCARDWMVRVREEKLREKTNWGVAGIGRLRPTDDVKKGGSDTNDMLRWHLTSLKARSDPPFREGSGSSRSCWETQLGKLLRPYRHTGSLLRLETNVSFLLPSSHRWVLFILY